MALVTTINKSDECLWKCQNLNKYCPVKLRSVLCLVMGKAEGSVQQEEWHGHVTAVTVAPEYRRLGLAAKLMSNLEEISEK